MNKKTALYMMLAGAAISAYDLATGKVYGPGAPLEKLQVKVYTDSTGKNWYVKASDALAIVGAYLYFK